MEPRNCSSFFKKLSTAVLKIVGDPIAPANDEAAPATTLMGGAGSNSNFTVFLKNPFPVETSRGDSAAVYCHSPVLPSLATKFIGSNVILSGSPLLIVSVFDGSFAYASIANDDPFKLMKLQYGKRKYGKSYRNVDICKYYFK